MGWLRITGRAPGEQLFGEQLFGELLFGELLFELGFEPAERFASGDVRC